MKKAMKDAEVTHVDAMHYVVLAGIRVGKDKTKTAGAGAKFWSTILEYEKKGKVTSNEVELADRSVPKYNRMVRFGRRLHSSSQSFVRYNHEVFVEDKRKRIEEQGGPSKKCVTRSTKMKDDAEASQALRRSGSAHAG